MNNVFHFPLLKQNTIKKKWMDGTTSQQDFDRNAKSKKYKFETRSNNIVFARKLESHISGL